jgi:hypothetical protein
MLRHSRRLNRLGLTVSDLSANSSQQGLPVSFRHRLVARATSPQRNGGSVGALFTERKRARAVGRNNGSAP